MVRARFHQSTGEWTGGHRLWAYRVWSVESAQGDPYLAEAWHLTERDRRLRLSDGVDSVEDAEHQIVKLIDEVDPKSPRHGVFA